TSASSRPSGQHDVQAALLTVADLPAGFTNDVSSSDPGLTGLDSCPPLDTRSFKDVKAEAAAAFGNGAGDKYVTEAILELTTSGPRRSMAGLAGAPRTCHEFTAQVSGVDVVLAVGTLDVPQIGDETSALQLTARAAGLAAVVEEHVVA